MFLTIPPKLQRDSPILFSREPVCAIWLTYRATAARLEQGRRGPDVYQHFVGLHRCQRAAFSRLTVTLDWCSQLRSEPLNGAFRHCLGDCRYCPWSYLETTGLRSRREQLCESTPQTLVAPPPRAPSLPGRAGEVPSVQGTVFKVPLAFADRQEAGR